MSTSVFDLSRIDFKSVPIKALLTLFFNTISSALGVTKSLNSKPGLDSCNLESRLLELCLTCIIGNFFFLHIPSIFPQTNSASGLFLLIPG